MRRVALVVSLAVFGPGCVEADPPALRTLVTVIATQDGQPADEATRRLVAHGRRALVVIEAALHTADAAGRRRLVRAAQQLADEDGAPLLGHVARHDDDPGVRHEARAALEAWARDRRPALAAAARAALARLEPAARSD